MSIYTVNSGLPVGTKLSLLNQMIEQLNGYYAQGTFNKLEIDALYHDLDASRQYLRNQGLGNTISTYTGWSKIDDEIGYSIWKYTPTSYSYSTNNQLYFNGAKLTNRGSGNSETATSFDKVYLFNGDSGSGYVDNTTESGTVRGTGFNINDTTQDYLYMGLSTTFSGFKVIWKTRGSNYTLRLDYWNGSAWTQLSTTTDLLVDNTNSFQSDGIISWTIPSTWATTSVNSQSKYWIRVSSTTNPITVANAYYIIPANNVIGLLALSSNDVLTDNWCWCSYNGSIYVTLPSQGGLEGTGYVVGTSSTANLQNFFIYNNPITADYLSSLYNPVKEISTTYSVLITDAIILATATSDYTVTLPTAHGNEGVQVLIKKVNATNTVTIAGQSGETIDGSSTKTLTTQYSFYRLVSDGGNWYVLGESPVIGTAGYVVDGGGSTISTGIVGDVVIPFDCTIVDVTMLADQTGSIVIDIWKTTYANFPPTVANTITASAIPTITSAKKSQDINLTGWTKTVSAGDCLRFNVNSVSAITRCSIFLRLRKK